MEMSYIARPFRIPLALLIGVSMVYVSELRDWATLHEHRGYWQAILVSASIAIGLGELLHGLNVWLDGWVCWFTKPVLRTFLQGILGLAMPLLSAVLVMAIFYGYHGYQLSQTTYMDQVIIPVGLLLLIANLYYFSHVLLLDRRRAVDWRRRTEQAQIQYLQQRQAEQAAKREVLRLAKLKFRLFSDQEILEIMMIISINRELFLHTRLPARQPWTTTIKDTIALLPKEDFFQVSKSCILARANIIRAYISSSNTIALELNFPEGGFAAVSQRTVPAFMIWYDQPIFPPHTDTG